jgi:hypothetical protein
VREVLHVEPWEKQRQILEAVRDHRRVAVRSCHHSGKTFIAAAAAQWFLRSFSPSLVISTAPTIRQVEKLLWFEIAEHQRRGGLGGNLLTTSLEISPAQRAYGFTTNEAEKFAGWHCPNIFVIVDEASGVEEPIYQAIEGILTSNYARLLLISQPSRPQGTFYEAFSSSASLYDRHHISAFDVPSELLNPGWKDERLAAWGEANPAYQIKVLGNFPPQGANSLIAIPWIEAAQERTLSPSEPCEIGVDVAYEGDDQSVAIVRQGQRVVAIADWRGHNTVESAGRVAALARQWKPSSIKVDHIGYGAGTLDTLQKEGFPAVGINVGEAAWDSERYANRRAELFFGLAERFEQSDIDVPVHDLLFAQLSALTYSYAPTGKLKLVSKQEMKKERLGNYTWQSPDFADALMLAFAQPVGFSRPVALIGAPRPSGGFEWKR